MRDVEGQVVPPALPRLAVNKTEAAQMIGVSVDFFDAHVAHELRCVRRGRRRLYPVRELERWLEKSAIRAQAMCAIALPALAAVLGG